MLAEYGYVPILLALLVGASYFDLRARRVPNGLNLLGLVAGLTTQWFSCQIDGLAAAAVGGFAALTCSLPLYLMRGLGAGDVKLLCVIGVFLGWPIIMQAMLFSLWVGGSFGLAILAWRKGLSTYSRRYIGMLRQLLVTGRLDYIPPQPLDPASQQLPFVPFIAAGTLMAIYLTTP